MPGPNPRRLLQTTIAAKVPVVYSDTVGVCLVDAFALNVMFNFLPLRARAAMGRPYNLEETCFMNPEFRSRCSLGLVDGSEYISLCSRRS